MFCLIEDPGDVFAYNAYCKQLASAKDKDDAEQGGIALDRFAEEQGFGDHNNQVNESNG